jgi:hypothetical protein
METKEEIRNIGSTKPIIDLNGLDQGQRFSIARSALETLDLNPYLEENFLNSCGSGLGRFSERNKKLIKLQKPEATQVLGYVDWKKLGRKPRGKGCGIFYLAPSTRKNKKSEPEEDEIELKGFYWVCGWDIKDTIALE